MAVWPLEPLRSLTLAVHAVAGIEIDGVTIRTSIGLEETPAFDASAVLERPRRVRLAAADTDIRSRLDINCLSDASKIGQEYS